MAVARTITLTASGFIWDGPCQLSGFNVNSTDGGTLQVKDGGSGGTPVGGLLTPALGYKRFKHTIATSAYAEIGGAALNLIFYFTTAE